MKKNPFQVSLKMDEETYNKLNDLVAYYEQNSLGSVNKNVVIRKAIRDLHAAVFEVLKQEE